MKRLILSLIVLAGPALADVTSPSGKTVDCYCTDSTGARVELGQMICLQVGGRMFTAQCQMSQNNPMWREMQDGCVSSSLTTQGRVPQQHGPLSSPIERLDPAL